MTNNLPRRSGFRAVISWLLGNNNGVSPSQADAIANSLLENMSNDWKNGGIPATLFFDENGKLSEIVAYTTEDEKGE